MEYLLSLQLLVSALLLGAIYALIATGLNLIYGTMRLLNVAHGDLVMVGAFTAYWVFVLTGIGPIWSIAAAMAIAIAIGVLTYYGLFARMLRGGVVVERLEANSLLIFFGISVVLQNVATLLFTATPRGYAYLDEVVRFAGVSVTMNRLVALATALACVIAVILFFRFTNLGLALRAMIQSRDASMIVGIKVERVNLFSLCLGFALASLGGVLISMNETIGPFMGLPYTIAAFVVVILGGLGNLMGGLVGGLLLGATETFGAALLGPSFRAILVYGVFILILLLRPEGLFGRRQVAR